MGAYDGADHPWLAGEKRLLADAIGAGARVIGVCLGAQLVAAALGADVYPAETREIGWGTVEATAGAAGTPFERLGDAYPVLHWHGDTFDLPDGATRTARTDACANQAYVYDGGRVVGLQFHLEVTPDVVDGLVDAAGDLGGGSHVQDAASIRGGTDRTGALNRQLRTLLDGLAAAGD
jgi:GMP synthase-like glutamine amidotransferase